MVAVEWVRGVQLVNPRVVGTNHLSFSASRNGITVDAIAFRQAGELERLSPIMDLAVVPEVQTWQGNRKVKLRVKAMRPHRDQIEVQ